MQTNPEQLVITLRRDTEIASVRLSDIYRNQNNDILLRAGDVITAHDAREYLTVLGAAGTQGRVAISKRNYSVLDALGDSRAWMTRRRIHAPYSCLRPRSREPGNAGHAADRLPVRPHSPGAGGAGRPIHGTRRPGDLYIGCAVYPGAEGIVGIPGNHECGLQRHTGDRQRFGLQLRCESIACR